MSLPPRRPKRRHKDEEPVAYRRVSHHHRHRPHHESYATSAPGDEEQKGGWFGHLWREWEDRRRPENRDSGREDRGRDGLNDGDMRRPQDRGRDSGDQGPLFSFIVPRHQLTFHVQEPTHALTKPRAHLPTQTARREPVRSCFRRRADRPSADPRYEPQVAPDDCFEARSAATQGSDYSPAEDSDASRGEPLPFLPRDRCPDTHSREQISAVLQQCCSRSYYASTRRSFAQPATSACRAGSPSSPALLPVPRDSSFSGTVPAAVPEAVPTASLALTEPVPARSAGPSLLDRRRDGRQRAVHRLAPGLPFAVPSTGMAKRSSSRGLVAAKRQSCVSRFPNRSVFRRTDSWPSWPAAPFGSPVAPPPRAFVAPQRPPAPVYAGTPSRQWSAPAPAPAFARQAYQPRYSATPAPPDSPSFSSPPQSSEDEAYVPRGLPLRPSSRQAQPTFAGYPPLPPARSFAQVASPPPPVPYYPSSPPPPSASRALPGAFIVRGESAPPSLPYAAAQQYAPAPSPQLASPPPQAYAAPVTGPHSPPVYPPPAQAARSSLPGAFVTRRPAPDPAQSPYPALSFASQPTSAAHRASAPPIQAPAAPSRASSVTPSLAPSDLSDEEASPVLATAPQYQTHGPSFAGAPQRYSAPAASAAPAAQGYDAANSSRRTSYAPPAPSDPAAAYPPATSARSLSQPLSYSPPSSPASSDGSFDAPVAQPTWSQPPPPPVSYSTPAPSPAQYTSPYSSAASAPYSSGSSASYAPSSTFSPRPSAAPTARYDPTSVAYSPPPPTAPYPASAATAPYSSFQPDAYAAAPAPAPSPQVFDPQPARSAGSTREYTPQPTPVAVPPPAFLPQAAFAPAPPSPPSPFQPQAASAAAPASSPFDPQPASVADFSGARQDNPRSALPSDSDDDPAAFEPRAASAVGGDTDSGTDSGAFRPAAASSARRGGVAGEAGADGSDASTDGGFGTTPSGASSGDDGGMRYGPATSSDSEDLRDSYRSDEGQQRDPRQQYQTPPPQIPSSFAPAARQDSYSSAPTSTPSRRLSAMTPTYDSGSAAATDSGDDSAATPLSTPPPPPRRRRAPATSAVAASAPYSDSDSDAGFDGGDEGDGGVASARPSRGGMAGSAGSDTDDDPNGASLLPCLSIIARTDVTHRVQDLQCLTTTATRTRRLLGRVLSGRPARRRRPRSRAIQHHRRPTTTTPPHLSALLVADLPRSLARRLLQAPAIRRTRRLLPATMTRLPRPHVRLVAHEDSQLAVSRRREQ